MVSIIIGLLIVFGSVYIYKNKHENVDISSQNTTGIEGSSTEKDESTQINTSGGTNNEDFNTYITKARTEFVNKNYSESLSNYNNALSIMKSDVVYAGMYTVYTAENNWTEALTVLNKAIELKPSFTDYWIWKIGLLNEKMNTSFPDLKKIYDQAIIKVDNKTKINLITYFANVAEDSGEKEIAIDLWKEAQSIFPDNSFAYQKEIDRLSLQ